MPIPTFVFLSLALTTLGVVADRSLEIAHGRSVFNSPAFVGLFAYWWCVLLPAVVYYCTAHGDWFLLYLATPAQISPLWVACGLLLWFGLGMLTFWGSARWLQMGMRSSVLTMSGLFGIFAFATWAIAYPTFSVIGSRQDWNQQAELESFWQSRVGLASGWIVILAAAAFLVLYSQLRKARI